MTTEEIMRQQKLYDESPEILIELLKNKNTKEEFTMSEVLCLVSCAADRAVTKVMENMFSRGLTAEDFSYLYEGKIKAVETEEDN